MKSEWPEESELRAANEQLRSWLDEAHAKLARAEEAADAETAQLKVTIARHQRQHHEQGTKLDELTRQVAGFSQQVASLTAAKEQAEKETRLLTTEAASLSEQLAQLTAAATRHRQREADQASMISSLTEQLELAEARHARDAAKQTELDAANEQLASVTKRLGDASELTAHLGQQLTAHDRSTHAVHADLAARDEQLAEANERERRLIDEQRRLLSRWAAVDRPSARSLAQSRFCETYSKCARVPREVGVLHDALVQVVCDYAARHSIGAHSRDHFLERMDASTGLRDDVHQSDTALRVLKRFVTRMWTASRKLNGVELSGMLNEALRHDVLSVLATQLVKSLNHFCCSARGSLPVVLYRGGGLPEQHRSFYEDVGKKFRAPMFLATSDRIDVARRFARREVQPHDMVIWRIVMPRSQHCNHVNFMQHDLGENDDEDEFLFVPYSTFVVGACQWSARPREEPHLLELFAMADNLQEDEELPLSSWN